jgi:enoyl-[acyl-carrier protein] reductase I
MLMKGKKGIVFGVANQRSIAWGIAKELLDAGADVAFAFLGERTKPVLQKLVADYADRDCKFYECDASDEAQLQSIKEQYEQDYGQCDFLVHSIAYADKDCLGGKFFDVTKESFLRSIDISAYSLVAMCRIFYPLMKPGSTILALSFLGAVRVIQNYNTMGVSKAALEACLRYMANDLGPVGIRVNAISAGPVNTLAARGISKFTDMLKVHRNIAPMRDNTTNSQVGKSALYLLSDMSQGVTGEIHYVDGGFAMVALGNFEGYNLQ